MSKYYQSLLDPRWQRKRLEIFERDKFTCWSCNSTSQSLVVHHRYYVSGREPWDYDNSCYLTVCRSCHSNEEFLEWDRQRTEKIFRLGQDAYDEEILKSETTPNIPCGEVVVLTKPLIDSCRANGSFTNATLRALGMTKASMKSGWPTRLIGKTISAETYKLAFDGRLIYGSGRLE